jgi:hypothetical protein
MGALGGMVVLAARQSGFHRGSRALRFGSGQNGQDFLLLPGKPRGMVFSLTLFAVHTDSEKGASLAGRVQARPRERPGPWGPPTHRHCDRHQSSDDVARADHLEKSIPRTPVLGAVGAWGGGGASACAGRDNKDGECSGPLDSWQPRRQSYPHLGE